MRTEPTHPQTSPRPSPSKRGRERAEESARLFRLLAECDDEDEAASIRNQVIELNMGVAETLARRYFGHGETADDLRQTAYLGLNKAVGRFDAGRGHDFLAYAVPTILGELRRHFRDDCWMVRPPRRVQDLQARIATARDVFVQGEGRMPDPWELAHALDAEVDDVVEALTADGCFTPSSLDRPVLETGGSLGSLLGGEDPDFGRIDLHLTLQPLLRDLPERDHRIVELRFFRDWTQEQIARDIGVTQMQVSRLLARILRQLRERLEEHQPAAAA